MTGLVLCCLGHVLVLYGRAEEAVAAHREALQLCRDYGAAEDVCRSCLIFSSDLSQCSRHDEAERLAADGIVFAVKTGHMNFCGIGIASNRIGALLKAGRWREAE